MSIFKRVRRLINANLNELMDRVESPEATVNQVVREMEQAILEMRQTTASAIAQHRLTIRRRERAERLARKWRENARGALADGDEELARNALRSKLDAESEAASIREHEVEQARLVAKLKEQMRVLEEKVQEARRKRDTLIAKRRVAEAQKSMLQSTSRASRLFGDSALSGPEVINGFADFDRLEDTIDSRLAEADALEELEAEKRGGDLAARFARRTRERDVEEALRELKDGASEPAGQ